MQIVDIEIVHEQGKNFKWSRPNCPRCKSIKIWSHGFLRRYYDRYKEYLYIKRYRCCSCRHIITMSISNYYKYYRSSIHDIYVNIKHKLKFKQWYNRSLRQRVRHWLLKFMALIYRHFNEKIDDYLDILENLYLNNTKIVM
jgi:hypothetical protein